jgi:hypothetical protein
MLILQRFFGLLVNFVLEMCSTISLGKHGVLKALAKVG